MDSNTVLFSVAAIFAGFLILRVIISIVRMSARFMVWAMVAAALFGLGYLWYQGQDNARIRDLPILEIPAPDRDAP